MKKTHLSVILLIISTLGYSQTNISGGVYENTTWSPNGNPHIAYGDVVVFEDVTLTIEPGVIIKFNSGTGLEIRGKLIAIGNITDSIQFTSNNNSPGINSWKGIVVKGTNSQTGDGHQVTLEYCIGEYASYFVDLNIAYEGPYVFRNCRFSFNHQTNNDGGLPVTIFESCKFSHNQLGLGSCQFESSATHCEFVNNEKGIEGFDIVDSCYFSNNTKSAVLGNGVVKNCIIVDNNIGVDCAFNSVSNTFIDNIVKRNNVGIKMHKFFNGYINFAGNIICDNFTYNLELLDFNNANIPFNCWCSSDSAFIRTTIHDGYVNPYFGLVNFVPFDISCVDEHVGIKSMIFKDEISVEIFPNPFSNELQISVSTDQLTEIKIYDINSRIVLHQYFNREASFDTNDISSGIHTYILKSNNEILKVGKIVKVQ